MPHHPSIVTGHRASSKGPEWIVAGFRCGAAPSCGMALILAGLFLAGCASSSPPTRSATPSASTPTPASRSTPTTRNSPAVQRGLATFYGGKYQGRKTASGETFDKKALTAAHQNIAFGTRVRVTNQENGKSVVVRINDRYQPTKGRIIDLSEGAFQQIAPLAQGVIPVTVELVR